MRTINILDLDIIFGYFVLGIILNCAFNFIDFIVFLK